MKITKQELRTIIHEELDNLHKEGFFGDMARGAKKGLYNLGRRKGETSYDELYTALVGQQSGLQNLMHTNTEELMKWTQGWFAKKRFPVGTKINDMVMKIDDLVDETRQGPDEEGGGAWQVDKFDKLRHYLSYYRDQISKEIQSFEKKLQSNPKQADYNLPVIAQQLAKVLYEISGAASDTGEGPSSQETATKYYAPHIEKALRAVQEHVKAREKSYMSESKRAGRTRKTRG